jgi:transcriptional regulator with XRE-family HTH domain
MAQPIEIYGSKQPIRVHFIAEWAECRHLRQADVARELGVDKSQVSRWFSGKLPEQANLTRLAGLFEIEVNMLFRHPDEDWIAQFFKDRSEEERNRARQVLEIAFPPKDGTNG